MQPKTEHPSLLLLTSLSKDNLSLSKSKELVLSFCWACKSQRSLSQLGLTTHLFSQKLLQEQNVVHAHTSCAEASTWYFSAFLKLKGKEWAIALGLTHDPQCLVTPTAHCLTWAHSLLTEKHCTACSSWDAHHGCPPYHLQLYHLYSILLELPNFQRDNWDAKFTACHKHRNNFGGTSKCSCLGDLVPLAWGCTGCFQLNANQTPIFTA